MLSWRVEQSGHDFPSSQQFVSMNEVDGFTNVVEVLSLHGNLLHPQNVSGSHQVVPWLLTGPHGQTLAGHRSPPSAPSFSRSSTRGSHSRRNSPALPVRLGRAGSLRARVNPLPRHCWAQPTDSLGLDGGRPVPHVDARGGYDPS